MMILMFTFRKKNLTVEVLLVSRIGSTGLNLVPIFIVLCKIQNFKIRIAYARSKMFCSIQ